MRGAAAFRVGCAGMIALGGTAAEAHPLLCPVGHTDAAPTMSDQRTLTGRLIYHDGIRQWFELRPDRRVCGEAAIQLTTSGDWVRLERLRGCRVSATGLIDFSPTGYYSLDLYQNVTSVRSSGACARKAALPDYSRARPQSWVKRYRVDMHVNYRRGDHPPRFHVRAGRTELSPWQAYAGYWLTGGFVLYGQCGHGFVVDHVFGTPAARPSHFDDPRTPEDMAAFDPETAATKGHWQMALGWTCTRPR